jgi:hypothetical protein
MENDSRYKPFAEMREMQAALTAWVASSPNRTSNNYLIETRLENKIFYRWNLKPNDPEEKSFVWEKP